MELGMIGLGRMGGNMTQRLLRAGHRVVVFDFNQDAVNAAANEGASPAASVDDLVSQLIRPARRVDHGARPATPQSRRSTPSQESTQRR